MVFSHITGSNEDMKPLKQSLSISYPVSAFKMNPLDYDFYGRQILANVFDPLVVLDKNLRPTPSLAVSYGMINEKTWNFILRKNIKFHDGSTFDYEDVFHTINLAKESPFLRTYLSSLDHIEKVSDFEFNLYTKYPDPLLLSRLSFIYIISNEYDESKPMIGTGAYVFDKQSEKEIFLFPNSSYFCSVPAIKEFKIIFQENLTDRLDSLTSGVVDFLAFVPQNAIPVVKQYNFQVSTIPSLEVQFLVFNFDSDIFKDLEVRRAFYSAIDPVSVISQLGVPLKVASQFSGSGVFGFNSGLKFEKLSSLEISKIFSEKNVKKVDLFFPKSAELLGNILKNDLKKLGVSLNIILIEDEKYEQRLKDNPGDIFFMAFKNELGDFSEFLDLIVIPNAKNNFSGFKDQSVFEAIKRASFDLDEKNRLLSLKNIMKELVTEKIFGVPLFEYEVSYAFSKDFSFEPRLDGIIYLNDIKQKR